MFVVHDTLPNQRKMKKNTMPTCKEFPFSKVMVFFPKIRIYYAFIIQEVQKTHFSNGFSTKKCKLLNGLKFISCTSISFTTKKFITKFHP
jgi:hypothetical protein